MVKFLRQRGQAVPSPAVFGQITEALKLRLRAWADEQGIPWLEFTKGQRKHAVVQPYRERIITQCGEIAARMGVAVRDQQGGIAGRLHWKAGGVKIRDKIGLATLDFPDAMLRITEASSMNATPMKDVLELLELQLNATALEPINY